MYSLADNTRVRRGFDSHSQPKFAFKTIMSGLIWINTFHEPVHLKLVQKHTHAHTQCTRNTHTHTLPAFQSLYRPKTYRCLWYLVDLLGSLRWDENAFLLTAFSMLVFALGSNKDFFRCCHVNFLYVARRQAEMLNCPLDGIRAGHVGHKRCNCF